MGTPERYFWSWSGRWARGSAETWGHCVAISFQGREPCLPGQFSQSWLWRDAIFQPKCSVVKVKWSTQGPIWFPRMKFHREDTELMHSWGLCLLIGNSYTVHWKTGPLGTQARYNGQTCELQHGLLYGQTSGAAPAMQHPVLLDKRQWGIPSHVVLLGHWHPFDRLLFEEPVHEGNEKTWPAVSADWSG